MEITVLLISTVSILAKCEGWPNERTSVVRKNSEETIIFVKTN